MRGPCEQDVVGGLGHIHCMHCDIRTTWPMRVFCVSQSPRSLRGYFLVHAAKCTHCPSYFAGSKRELTSILSSW